MEGNPMITIKTSLSVLELKSQLNNLIFRRLRLLKRRLTSDSFRQYRKGWDKICLSKMNQDVLKSVLLKEIIRVENLSDKDFKLSFGKKRFYDLTTIEGKNDRRETWKRTQRSRSLKKKYWEPRSK